MNVRTRTDRSRQNEGWQRSPETTLAPPRFLLRSVRIALQATAVVLFVLAIYPILPGHGTLDGPVYAALLGIGALATFIAALLPWPRLFERGYGISVLVTWSAFDIVLITLGIAVTGSGRSELWLLYALIALFFAASYPHRAQVALLATTLVAYLGVLAATSWEISPARIVLRVAVLLLVAFLASFLSRELIEEAAGHDAARTESEHQAELAMAMNTRLVEAQEEERIRVARELHDDLGPLLASVSLFVRRLETERGEDEDLGLSTVRRIAELAVRRMRALAWSLRPVELDEIGLVPAVSRLASDVRLPTSIAPYPIGRTCDSFTAWMWRSTREDLTRGCRSTSRRTRTASSKRRCRTRFSMPQRGPSRSCSCAAATGSPPSWQTTAGDSIRQQLRSSTRAGSDWRA